MLEGTLQSDANLQTTARPHMPTAQRSAITVPPHVPA
jgi:hypothetical protein